MYPIEFAVLDPAALLKKHFGHDQFRPGQQQVIETLLEGRSALAIFPTGGGKSLCYQLPALALDGITLVVSPLIALMKDQVETLQSLDIAAVRLDSTLEYSEVKEIYSQMEQGTLKLVYVAPERLGNEGFLRRLRRCRISMLAVDEAHCISEWGHNFRPDYLKLAELAEELQVERVLALTATATPAVAENIRDRFQIDPSDHVQTPFHRSNLTFSVVPCEAEVKKDKLAEQIQNLPPGATVVYVTLQRTAEEVAGHLKRCGLDARAYHAGMRDDHRSELQDEFMAGQVQIVVATIAFGMGIDKSDIRYVYHYNLPKSLENYVQESGRAGRDGEPAACQILASRSDLVVLENFVYGDTPSRSAIKSLVEHLVMQGEHFSISKYDLSYSKDIRPLVVSTALTYLEIDGVIIPEGPFYAGYKYQFIEPMDRVLAGHTPERQEFLKRIFAASKKARVWYTADIGEVAAQIGEPEDRVRKALDYLSEMGDIKTQPSGLRHRYRLDPDADTRVSFLTDGLMQRFETREQGEIERIRTVVEHCESSECLASRILQYFGDAAIECGECSVCTGANVGGALPSVPPSDISQEDADVVRALRAEDHQALRQPRQLARYLCGISSPATTRARLHRKDHFGLLEEVPFREVLSYVESLI